MPPPGSSDAESTAVLVGRGVEISGFTTISPLFTAILKAPANGARARRIVFGASGLPFFEPPPLANRRCHSRIVSGVTSRRRRPPSSGRTYDSAFLR